MALLHVGYKYISFKNCVILKQKKYLNIFWKGVAVKDDTLNLLVLIIFIKALMDFNNTLNEAIFPCMAKLKYPAVLFIVIINNIIRFMTL